MDIGVILNLMCEQISSVRDFTCKPVEACPYFLNPSRLAKLARSRMFDEMQSYSVMDCVECGSCTFACPSNIPIVQLIRTAKSQLRQSAGKSA